MTSILPVTDAHPSAATAGRLSSFAVVQSLLSTSGPLEVAGWLRDLARAFGVGSAGFAGFMGDVAALRHWESADGRPVSVRRWPWEELPHLLAELSRTATAMPVAGPPGTGGWLATACQQEGVNWLLWLEDDIGRGWTSDEQAALALGVLALARRLSTQVGGGPGWVERARRQQRLERAAAVVRRLTHDFNNVLTAILGFTELGLAQAAPDSPVHQFLTEVFEATQQGSRMVRQLTLFSRRTSSRCQPASVVLVVREVESRLRKAWGPAIDFRVEVAEELPRVAADPETIRLLLGQLLDNARQAVAAGGAVTLTAQPTELTEADCLDLLGSAAPGSHVEIGVSDTGPGLSAEARQRVLVQPFFSTKPRHRGMGLATVYGNLCAQRGAIRLESVPEHGTRVSVYLPVAAGGKGLPAHDNGPLPRPGAGESVFRQPF